MSNAEDRTVARFQAVIEEVRKGAGKNSTALNTNKGSNFERSPRSREVARQLKQRREKEREVLNATKKRSVGSIGQSEREEGVDERIKRRGGARGTERVKRTPSTKLGKRFRSSSDVPAQSHDTF